MAVTKKPEVYEASDGAEFPTLELAERHDTLIKAHQQFDNARKLFQRAIAGTQVTADGVPFNLTEWRTYYYITLFGSGGPAIHTVSFGYGSEVLFDDDSDIRIREPESGGRTDLRTMLVSSLYYHEHNAKAALVEALAEHSSEVGEKIAKLKAEIANIKGRLR